MWIEKGLNAGIPFKDLKAMTNDQIREALDSKPDEAEEEAESGDAEEKMREELRNKIRGKYGK